MNEAEAYLERPYEPQTKTYPVTLAAYVDRPPGEASEWLRIIRQANAIAEARGDERLFGAPVRMGPWWAGGFEEEYEEARVILPETEAEPVRIIPFTDRAVELITQAAEEVRHGADGEA